MALLLLSFAAASSGVLAVTETPDVVSMLQVGIGFTSRAAHTVTSLESYGPLALSQLRRQSPAPVESAERQAKGNVALEAMIAEPANALVQLNGCRELSGATTTGSWLAGYTNQEYFVGKHAHEAVLAAMNRFPENLPLQLSCARALNNMVHLNAPMARIVGDAGAMEALVAVMRRFPDSEVEMGDLFGIIGSLCDYDMPNRERVAKLGGIDLAFNITRNHYSSHTVLGLQCLVSTQCWPQENHEQLKRNGYVSATAQHMRDFPLAAGIRGEGIFVLSMCFGGEPDSDEVMVQHGMIEEIVAALRDAPHMQLDVLSTTDRIYSFGIELLLTFASKKPEWGEREVQAGAVEQVAASMVDYVRNQANANVAMQRFGFDHLDVLNKGCKTLRVLGATSSEGGERLAAVRDELRSELLSPDAPVPVPYGCTTLLA